MKTNTRITAPPVYTHEGAPAARISEYAQLRRSVLSCLLWEKSFYESGESIADRIATLAANVPAPKVAALAVEAREAMKLRHVPLLLCTVLAKIGSGSSLVSDTLANVIRRADEPGEFLSLYWRNGKTPLSKQVKKGLAKAIAKFSAYQLGKYNGDAAVKLRDILFLTHAKPKDIGDNASKMIGGVSKPNYKRGEVMRHEGTLYSKLVEGTLESPDTWEVALSSGKDKCETFTRLLQEGKLGYLALLRNLRNMVASGVDTQLIRDAILARKGAEVVLPFRYVAAARACPQLEPYIDQALSEAIAELPVLPGKTIVLADVSRSMLEKLSGKSDLTRMDAACALASLINGDVRMFSFSNRLVEVPPRRGMAGVDALMKSQEFNGTALFDSVAEVQARLTYDRLIIITDEQANAPNIGYVQGRLTRMPGVKPGTKGYCINVGIDKNGVGYGPWTHIDGFSEAVLRWIIEFEKIEAQ